MITEHNNLYLVSLLYNAMISGWMQHEHYQSVLFLGAGPHHVHLYTAQQRSQVFVGEEHKNHLLSG